MSGGIALSRPPALTPPVWMMLAVAALQVAVLWQVMALRDRVVQVEAGAEFQDYAQGCAAEGGAGGLALPPETPSHGLGFPIAAPPGQEA